MRRVFLHATVVGVISDHGLQHADGPSSIITSVLAMIAADEVTIADGNGVQGTAGCAAGAGILVFCVRCIQIALISK